MTDEKDGTGEDEPGFRPAFLTRETAEAAPYIGCDEVPTFDDEVPESEGETLPVPADAPGEGIRTRYSEIARLHALGQTNNQIASTLGYTASRLSIVLRHPFVQSEIRRIRDAVFDRSTVDTLKEASRDGVRLIHNTILDNGADLRTRIDASKWAKEQAYGKAHQSHSVENNTLNVYIDAVREMTKKGEIIDVTPGAPGAPGTSDKNGSEKVTKDENAPDQWSKWLDDNL